MFIPPRPDHQTSASGLEPGDTRAAGSLAPDSATDPTAMLDDTQTDTPSATASVAAGPVAPSPEAAAALARFHSCRWRAYGDDGPGDHCTHRDVLPFAGTTGFNAEAWCPTCAFYKLRRSPRKRENVTY